VWADQEITFKGVSIIGESGDVSGKFSAVSNAKGIYLNTSKDAIDSLKTADPLPVSNNLSSGPQKVVTKTVMQAKAVHFTADNGDIFVNGVSFDRGNVATGSEFQARAKGTIGIYDSAVNHSKVAIAANTVVLKDVTFAGNDVTLRSQSGFVAAAPGTGKAVTPGQINFVSGVFHSGTEVKLPNMTRAEGHDMFHQRAGEIGKTFSGLKIQNLAGNTTVNPQ
jgi:hypothetical protein